MRNLWKRFVRFLRLERPQLTPEQEQEARWGIGEDF